MVLPSHTMDYSWHMRRTNEAITHGGNIAWAKSGELLRGLGYTYDVEHKIDNTLSYNMVLRKIGKEEYSLSVKYETKNDALKKSLTLNMDHPSDPFKQAYFEVLIRHGQNTWVE